MKLQKNKRVGTISVLISAILWGFVGVFVRCMTDYGFSAMQITAVRSFITWVILFLYLCFTDRSKLKIRIKDSYLLALIGIVSILCFNALYFYTIQITNVSVAAVLLYAWPVIVMLLSIIIFHEKCTVNKLLAAAVSFIGCFVVMGIWKNGGINGKAMVTGLASAVAYATYSIFCVFALKKYHFFTILFYAFAFATLGSLPFISIQETVGLMAGSTRVVLTALAQGVITSALPYIFFTNGLKHLETGIAAILTSCVPMVSTIVNTWVYHEKFEAEQLAGSLLIIFSIVILKQKEKAMSSEDAVRKDSHESE